MSKRFIAVLTVAVLALAACDDAPESGRTILSILDFNGGSPVQSDVVFNDGTNPPYIVEDIVPVTFVARPYNSFITGTTHDRVVVDRYHITWERTDGGTGALQPRDEAASILVQMGQETEAFIRIVTWGDKDGPILSPLQGGAGVVSMRADITFYGHEVGTTEDIELSTSVSVNFADASNVE